MTPFGPGTHPTLSSFRIQTNSSSVSPASPPTSVFLVGPPPVRTLDTDVYDWTMVSRIHDWITASPGLPVTTHPTEPRPDKTLEFTRTLDLNVPDRTTTPTGLRTLVPLVESYSHRDLYRTPHPEYDPVGLRNPVNRLGLDPD